MAIQPEQITRDEQAGRRRCKLRVALLVVLNIGALSFLLHFEMTTSALQSRYLSAQAAELSFRLVDGPSSRIRFPAAGPYDHRLGYDRLPGFTRSLKQFGYRISAQAELSEEHARLIDRGLFPQYDEKTRAGLEIVDRDGSSIYNTSFPERVFERFEDIPPLVVDTLLFIEDRYLLDQQFPRRNPAVQWERLGRALLDYGKSKIKTGHNVPGGSTLATQIEKFRHSPAGITGSPREKFRQMASASLRAYRSGRETLERRRQIVLDYINSVPLAAVPGFGEINGLGDGLWAYYDANLAETARLLKEPPAEDNAETLEQQARAYRRVLSLFLAHRRPSDYLSRDPEVLSRQVGVYLPILKDAGILPAALYERAKDLSLVFRRAVPPGARSSYLNRKAANLLRTRLLRLLDLDTLYELDRLDLRVGSTIDNATQQRVTEVLDKLRTRDYVKQVGLEGYRLLSSAVDPAKIVFSFTLYESTPWGNFLRIQTDNLDQPFNVNESVKLDLGSTAKFRTLVTYLEVIELLYQRYSGLKPEELKKAAAEAPDALSAWVIAWFRSAKEPKLPELLEAAMNRRYSASPHERFFTAGGVHTFSNFNRDDNGRVVTVREAIRHSINLPFIRLMRDIVNFFAYDVAGSTARTLDKMEADKRKEYLARFADQEGKVFLRRFYSKYGGRPPEEIVRVLLEGVRPAPLRFAAIFGMLYPEGGVDDFSLFMRLHYRGREFSRAELEKLQRSYSDRGLTLADKGYLARVHPLELWTAAYLMRRQNSSFADVVGASREVRQEVYEWLFRTRYRRAQDTRIRTILEAEAFSEIHRRWQRLGYQLDSLVPSYATALGTSADRPDALAVLMGIVINEGRKLPAVRMKRLEFASATPFATTFELELPEGEQVMSPLLAGVLKRTLLDVAAQGTAIRLRDGFKVGDQHFPIGGKTGTGDHRFKVFGPGGRLLEERVVSRTATFMFILGERHFGTVSAFVSGPEAAGFNFTSALPVQLLKILEPALQPLLQREAE